MNENHIVKLERLSTARGRFPAGTVVVGVVVGPLEPGRGVVTRRGVSIPASDVFVHSVDEVIAQLDRSVPYRFTGRSVRHANGVLVYDDGAVKVLPVPYNA